MQTKYLALDHALSVGLLEPLAERRLRNRGCSVAMCDILRLKLVSGLGLAEAEDESEDVTPGQFA